jgi:predicted HD phosphohydrolase
VNAPTSVDQLLALLARGADVYDEPDVDALSHALQCGALLRRERPDDLELAVAGLVHDISDIDDPHDHRDHDRRGAELVRPLLGDRVAALVGAHVIAKRYLVATDANYRATLSARSIATLADQGDALADPELLEHPDFDAMLCLRRADERAKQTDAVVAGLDTWRAALEEVASA